MEKGVPVAGAESETEQEGLVGAATLHNYRGEDFLDSFHMFPFHLCLARGGVGQGAGNCCPGLVKQRLQAPPPPPPTAVTLLARKCVCRHLFQFGGVLLAALLSARSPVLLCLNREKEVLPFLVCFRVGNLIRCVALANYAKGTNQPSHYGIHRLFSSSRYTKSAQ